MKHLEFSKSPALVSDYLRASWPAFPPLLQACVDPNTKDELHMVEMEGQDAEGQKIKAVLVSLKPSTLPSVSNPELVFPFMSSSIQTVVRSWFWSGFQIPGCHGVVCALQVCLGGFTITPPAVFRLKAGSGPVHVSGQHLVSKYLSQESHTGGQPWCSHPVWHVS